MPKSQSVPEILKKYKTQQKFETDAAFADALGVSRQSLSQWVTGVHAPSVPWLLYKTLQNAGTWIDEMCVELLKVLNVDVKEAVS